jgi:AcrR family transcriptional regulator
MARRRLQPAERRRELLQEGLRAFTTRPYEEVAVADIAARAGASEGLVYRYFGDKRSFYLESIRTALGLAAEASDPDPELPPRQRFEQGLHGFIEAVERSPYAVPHVLQGGPAADPDVRAEVEAAVEAVAARIIERMQVDDPPELLGWSVRAWIFFVQVSTAQWLEDRAIPRETLFELQIVSFRAAAAHALGIEPVPTPEAGPPPWLP